MNFENYSGLKLNLGKNNSYTNWKMQWKRYNITKLHYVKSRSSMDPLKLWGYGFLKMKMKLNNLNIDDRLKKMETMINIWTSRHLSIKGKITIIRTLILPQIQFLFSSISISAEILKRI